MNPTILKTPPAPTEQPSQPLRRKLLGAASVNTVLALSGAGAIQRVHAQVVRTRKPLLIGLATDDTGQYAASGRDERRGMIMAINEANERGGVIGRRLEITHTDTQGNAEVGASVAEQMIARQGVAFLIGGVHSGVASAMSTVAQKFGCIYFNSNSSSPTEAGKDCHRTKFVWDGNSTNFSTSVVNGAMSGYGRDWVLITSDYGWGHNTAKGIRELISANGGRIVDELIVSQNTRDFRPQLETIKKLSPRVVATAVGGEGLAILRAQVQAAGLDRSVGWINNQKDWPDVYGLGRDSMFGVFGTTWYWGLKLPGVTDFVARYQKANPDYRIRTPGNVFYNGYMATRELLRAIERTGSTNNIKLIRDLERLRVPARDRMQHFDAYMNPQTHQLQQTIYIASYNSRPTHKDDLFRILDQQRPEDVQDRASGALCQLESLAALPTYEP